MDTPAAKEPRRTPPQMRIVIILVALVFGVIAGYHQFVSDSSASKVSSADIQKMNAATKSLRDSAVKVFTLNDQHFISIASKSARAFHEVASNTEGSCRIAINKEGDDINQLVKDYKNATTKNLSALQVSADRDAVTKACNLTLK
jgi:hypothetical protein